MRFLTKGKNFKYLLYFIWCFAAYPTFANTKFPTSTVVLIIGGGPGGLSLANFLEKHKINYVLVDKNSSPSNLSKATGIHVNSMKILNTLNGITDSIIKKAVRLDKNVIYHNDEIIKTIHFEHGVKDFEKNISISQQELEKILLANINHKRVFYNNELIFFYESDDKQWITILINNQTKKINTIKSRFIIGSDGGSSSVRRILGINFLGISNPDVAVSFDARITNSFEKNSMYMIGNSNSRFVFVPISDDGLYKISGKYDGPLDKKSLTDIVYSVSKVTVIESSIGGIVSYYKHSRVASNFSYKNRIFLIGDAAHVFFPEGGYGLNVAIEDAYILADAIIDFLKTNDDEKLNDYSASRRIFALKVQEEVLKMKSISTDNNAKGDFFENQIY